MTQSVLDAVTQLLYLAVLLGALQWCFPNRAEQKVLRPQVTTDLMFFFGQHLVWLALQFGVLIILRDLLVTWVTPQVLIDAIRELPLWAQAISILLFGDFCTYWFHRASHRFSFLWRFHQVHHSAPHLDWLAAHREHPVDGMLTQVAQNAGALLCGIDLTALAGLIAFRGLWATFIHSNVRLPLPGLRVLIGAPELHHWHHLNTRHTRHNFSNLAPWLDKLFGTYHCPDEQDFPLGLPGQPTHSYLRWIFRPPRS